jgi:hypothetical protein
MIADPEVTLSRIIGFDILNNPDIPRALEDYKRHLGKHCLWS